MSLFTLFSKICSSMTEKDELASIPKTNDVRKSSLMGLARTAQTKPQLQKPSTSNLERQKGELHRTNLSP